MYPLFFQFTSHLGHHRPLSRDPCAIQWVLFSYLFHTEQCVYVNPNLPIHSSVFPPLAIISLFSIPIILFLFCKQVHLYHFCRFHIKGRLYICLSLSDLLHSLWQSLGVGGKSEALRPWQSHEEGGSTYTKAGSSLRSPPGNPRASTPITRACLLYYFVLSPTPLTLQAAVPHHLFRRRS